MEVKNKVMRDLDIVLEYKYVNGVNSNVLSKHMYSNRVFPFCVAVSVEKGCYFVEVNNKRYEINEGETVFISSFVPHNVGIDGDGVVTYTHFLCSWMNIDIFNFSKVDYLIVKNSNICKLLTEMNNYALETGLYGKIGVDKSISEIVLMLIRDGVLKPEYPDMDLWLYKVLNYIKKNVHKAITADEIVELSGYSKTTF